MYFLALASALLAFTSATSSISQRSSACNNSPDLCSKSYSAITHLGAHDSPFVRDASTGYSTSGNQYYNSTVQLSAGVRLLTAQVHKTNGAWHLCHSSCDLLDAGLLSDWLKEIKEWLDSNPNDVVTVLLVNSDSATPTQLDTQFTEAGIKGYAYYPASTSTIPTAWPTLQELISANTRLMTFATGMDTSKLTTDTSYLMDEFTFIFENPYDNVKLSDFSCQPDRPTAYKDNAQLAISSGRMPFMNHFLYEQGLFDIETPAIDNITTTNSANQTVGSLGYSATTCKTTYGKAPTFILVDFFDQGPAIDTVDSLNGVTSPVGRTQPPERDTSDDTNRVDASFAGVQALKEQVVAGKTPTTGAWIWASGKWSWGGINLSGGSLVS